MLYEAHGISKFVVICGYTDLRKGISGDRIKALLWEGSGFLLLYKRFENGSISWPRTPDEAVSISKHEYRLLLQGLNPVKPKVRDISPSTAF